MKVFKRGLATFLTALMLIPSRPPVVVNAAPLDSVSAQASTETAAEEKLQEESQKEGLEEDKLSEGEEPKGEKGSLSESEIIEAETSKETEESTEEETSKRVEETIEEETSKKAEEVIEEETSKKAEESIEEETSKRTEEALVEETSKRAEDETSKQAEETTEEETSKQAEETTKEDESKEEISKETEKAAEESKTSESKENSSNIKESLESTNSGSDNDTKKEESNKNQESAADRVPVVKDTLLEKVAGISKTKKLMNANAASPSNAKRSSENKSGDKVGFNTGSHVYYVVSREDFDDGSGDAFFEEDGSYKISIPEENPYFPYEVQFTYEGKTRNEWFMTPDDKVMVGDHEFSVSPAFDNSAVTQMSLEIAGDTVVVYPKKKVFTDTDDGGISTTSLLPLEERYLSDVDLTAYTPVDLTQVSVKYIFGEEPLKDTDKVMWTCGWDGDDYSISQSGDKINLSCNTNDGRSSWQMIVGEDNQLNMGNIRYLINIHMEPSGNWLVPTVYKQFEDGKRAKVSVSDSNYYDYAWRSRELDESRQFDIDVPFEELDRENDAYISLAVNESVFPFGTTQYSSLKAYRGKAIAADADITDQILTRDMTAKDAGYRISEDISENGFWITLAAYDSKGNLTGQLPIKVHLYRMGNYLHFDGMYDFVDERWDRVSLLRWEASDENDYDTETRIQKRNYISILEKGSALDKEYYLKASYSKGGVTSSSSVTAAYVGQFSSIAQAAAAGAADIRNSLFNQNEGGGYKADYSKGVYFTVFVGADSSEKQEIYQYFIKTGEEEEKEPELSDATGVTFTGLKDGNGDDVPCYRVDVRDAYAGYSYVTLLVDKDVDLDLTSLALVFEIRQKGINLFVNNSPVESGKGCRDFSKGPVHYTAGSESKKDQQNYWVQVVQMAEGEGGLYINSLQDPDAHTEKRDGVIYSTREMFLDGRYDYQHDILLINKGTNDIPAIKAELVSEQVELDPYWTLKGNQPLLGFDSLQKDYDHWYGELQNFAKLRIKPKEGIKNADISGTLTITSAGKTLMVLTLTGNIGDPCITTTEIPDAVLYVPYDVMIENNNKYQDINSVSYYLEEGILPKGINLYNNGELYGMPRESGTFEFTVRMDNSLRAFKSSYQPLTLIVKENTNLNVYGESDEGYTILDDGKTDGHIGTEAGAGTRDYVLRNTNDQLFISVGEFDDFRYLWLNGELLVEGADYTKESGSTRMTIKSQTFATKAKSGINTIAAEFHKGGSRQDLKRTAQNFRISVQEKPGNGEGSSNSSNSSGSSGSRGSSSSNSGNDGVVSNSMITHNSQKGYVHKQRGIITKESSGYSRWQQDDKGWKLLYANKTTAAGSMVTLDDGRKVEQILWEKINGAWYAFGADGYLKSGWVFDYQLNGWYNVSADTGMQTGWYTDAQDKHTYYLDPATGNLTTGWKSIDDKWYYFNAVISVPTWQLDEETGKWYYNIRSKSKPFGAMYQNEATPDGYRVDENGVWDGKR